MTSKFGRYIPLVFLISLLFILGNLLLTTTNIRKLTFQDSRADKATSVLTQIDTTLINLLNAETGQRGYLITQNKSFLDPYFKASKRLDSNLNQLKNLLKDDPEELKLTVDLEMHSKKRMDLLKEGVRIRDEEGYDAAYSFIQEGTGKKEMDQTRTILARLTADEQNKLDARRETLKQLYNALYFGIIAGSVLSFFFVVFSYLLIRRELERRTELEKNKDEFINMASHELKTPITSLKVYIELVRKKIEEKDLGEARRYLSRIEEQTSKLTNLIIDLLDMSRVQTGKMKMEKEPLNLDALIDDTAEAIQGTTKRHKLIVKGGLDKMVYADRYRVYQVLVNLLTNAIKYSPRGGKVIVESKIKRTSALVSVKDHGIGIDIKFQKKIFDRLYQVTDSREKTYPGLGIGLFISSEIIKRHGGKIWVKSRKGHGSTFYFTLPFQE